MSDLWELEKEIYDQGYELICGVDEAGRGPLAGPVCAAAVILPRGMELPGLNDSKKLTEKKREALFSIIKDRAAAFAVSSVSAAEIAEMNILNARMLAMRRAVALLPEKPGFVLIDGNCGRGFELPHECIVGGDGLSANIAAASILAKVSRDEYMRRLNDEYPGYHFDRHKGYGTKLHYAALDELGPCPEHRMTFLRKYYERRS